MKNPEAILIVDDDLTTSEVWADALEERGFFVYLANNSNRAVDLLKGREFGLVLVNIAIKGELRGLDFLEWIRDNYPGSDIIVITTDATLDSSLKALRKAAFDYLVKPVSVVEVQSRVDRCMEERREAQERLQMIQQIEMMLKQLKKGLLPEGVSPLEASSVLETPSIVVDRRKRLVVQEGEPVQLSPTEFDMLDYMVKNSDRVVSASELIRAVQGYDMDEIDARPIVRVNIRRLRQKIEDDTTNPRHIITVRSRGYRFAG